MNRPVATLSLDLDNEWAYLRARRSTAWKELPSYLDRVVPQMLAFLAQHGLQITFFVVGQDAALTRHREVLASIAQAGHEIANHSFGHETGFHTQREHVIISELERADDAIEKATGYKPVGFRGPSFGLSAAVLNALAERAYLYDASTFPTLIGPLARLYYRARTSGGNAGSTEGAPMLGESGFAALRSLKPYRWQLAGCDDLIEIPVTTMPLFRLPIHATYLHWLGSYSTGLALNYFRAALRLCRLRGVAPSLLLHPTDFLGCDDVRSLDHLPGMNVPGAQKRHLMAQLLRLMQNRFDIKSMRTYAEALAQEGHLPRRPFRRGAH